MYLKQKYEVFSLVVGATAVNSLDWEQNQTHYFHIENCCLEKSAFCRGRVHTRFCPRQIRASFMRLVLKYFF